MAITTASAPAAAKPQNAAKATDLDTSGPAKIGDAKEFSPSGAPRQTTDIDMSHPAVDTNPRANTTVDMNRIDFNDPTIDGAEAVKRNLEAQAKG